MEWKVPSPEAVQAAMKELQDSQAQRDEDLRHQLHVSDRTLALRFTV